MVMVTVAVVGVETHEFFVVGRRTKLVFLWKNKKKQGTIKKKNYYFYGDSFLEFAQSLAIILVERREMNTNASSKSV